MQSSPVTQVEHTSDREFTITRLLPAPRALVWEVVTDPEHLLQWFGPDGFVTTTHEFDFRVGGVWRFTMHGPDGVDYPNQQLFREIVPQERIAYLHTGGAEGKDEEGFVASITLVSEGKQTRITLRSTFPTAEALRVATEKYGVVEGGKQHLARFASYLTLPRSKRTVILSRILDASPEQVWEAWTVPEKMVKWFSPPGSDAARAAADLRVGGRWAVTFLMPDGSEHDNTGEYLEIERPGRLVFTWVLRSPEGAVVMEAHHVLSLIPSGKKTRLTFVSRTIIAEPGAEPYLAGVEQGWAGAFDKLARAF